MRVTKQEVMDLTGAAEGAVAALPELILANKFVHELGFIAKMSELEDLNLAFNELASIEDLARNVSLECLNVAHNRLGSLDGVAPLVRLRSLNASHNRIRDVAPLAHCLQLQECWLQNNRLADLGAVVQSLRPLQSLTSLVLQGNPCVQRSGYRPWVISQLPQLRLLDGRDVADEREQQAAAEPVELGRLSPSLAVVDHSGSSDEECTPTSGGGLLRRGEWQVTDSRGQTVLMGREKKQVKKKKAQARAKAARTRRDYLGSPRGMPLTPREELLDALAGARAWRDAAVPVADRLAAAVVAAMADGAPSGRGSRRSPSPHLSKAAAGSNETCRRLQRAAASVCNEALPALRLGEDLARRLQPNGSSSTPPQSARRSSKGPTAAPAPSPARSPAAGTAPKSPAGKPTRSKKKAAAQKARAGAPRPKSVGGRRSQRGAGAAAVRRTSSGSSAKGSRAAPEDSSSDTPRREAWFERLSSPARQTVRAEVATDSNGVGTGQRRRDANGGGIDRRRNGAVSRPRQPPAEVASPVSSPAGRGRLQLVSPPSEAQCFRRRTDCAFVQSDSDTDSDGDFETVGRARLKQQRAAGRQQGPAPNSPQLPPQPSNGSGAAPGAAQYVPASVELLGRASWHAAAAEFGAAESALGSVNVVAADPPYADGEPCFSPNPSRAMPTCQRAALQGRCAMGARCGGRWWWCSGACARSSTRRGACRRPAASASFSSTPRRRSLCRTAPTTTPAATSGSRRCACGRATARRCSRRWRRGRGRAPQWRSWSSETGPQRQQPCSLWAPLQPHQFYNCCCKPLQVLVPVLGVVSQPALFLMTTRGLLPRG